MYQKMLVPLDGSELAEVVFPYAKELAGRLDIDIVLLYVSTPGLSQFTPMRRAYIKQAAETIRRQSKAIQKKTGIPRSNKLLKVRGELTEGCPAEEILRYADENAIDLILVATHGRSGNKRWAMGNVADKVLRAGIPDETPYDQWPKKTKIAPLDGSELAESALPHAEALAKQRDNKLVEVLLLRVCEPPALPSYYVPEISEMPLNWGQYEQQEIAKSKQVAQQYLARVEKRLKDSQISNVRSAVLVGKAADEIVDYVNKNPFSLLVIASHGRSGLSRWVHGSVADNVLQGVSSPILLIRPP